MFMGSFGGEELGRADLVDWAKPIENNNASAPIIRQRKEVDFFFMSYSYKTSLRSNNGKLIFTPKEVCIHQKTKSRRPCPCRRLYPLKK